MQRIDDRSLVAAEKPELTVLPTPELNAETPAHLLDEATSVSGKGITDTLIAGLELVKRSRAFSKAQALRGKIHLDLDIDDARERAAETRGRHRS